MSLSTAFEARADKYEDFRSVALGPSIPLETGEGTGRSIEIGRLAVDDQSPGSLFRRILGIDQDGEAALGHGTKTTIAAMFISAECHNHRNSRMEYIFHSFPAF